MAVQVDDGKVLKPQQKPVASNEERLPPCDKPHVAEASRNDLADEACDDGVH